MSEKKTPEIRFNGFGGEWEERNFFDNIERTIDFRGRTPRKLGLDWSESGYLALSALNVKDGYIDPSIDAHYGNQELYDVWMNGNELRKGQVLFTTEAPMGNVAQIPDDKKYILSQRTIAFNVKSRMITEDFLAVLLRSPIVFKNLTAMSSGGTAKGVSQKSMTQLKVSIPNNLTEQSFISAFLLNLDNLITLRQCKYDKTVQMKKAMLEKMFPKKGKNVPEVRFAGYSGEWEERTIGEYGSFYYGKSAPKWSVTKDAQTPCIRYGELYTKFNENINTVYSYTNIPADKLKFSTGREVLVPRVGEEPMEFANCSWLSIPNVAIGEMISVYNTEQNPLFVAFYFNALMKKEFAEKVEGGNVSNLYYNRLLDIPVSFPSIAEQEVIAEFFDKINTAIVLYTTELEKLKNIKKAMLEKMFV